MIDHKLGHSPVDTDVFSSDETSLLRAEIEHHTGDIERRPPPACGMLRCVSAAIHPEISVGQPGEMELTRTLPARLTASAWISAVMPPLAAV